MRARRLAVIALLLGLADLGLRLGVPSDIFIVLQPIVFAIAIVAWFIWVLFDQVGSGLFGEIGVLYLVLVLVYTVFPAYTFIAFDFDIPLLLGGLNVLNLSLAPSALALQFWRHTLLIGMFAIGYVATRNGVRTRNYTPTPWKTQPVMIGAWLVFLASCIGIVTVSSAPVSNYIEHYTRFDHLSEGMKRAVGVALSLKTGAYAVVLALLFGHFARFKWVILLFIPSIVGYELYYSFGSRIQALVVLLSCIGYYHHLVAAIPIRKGLAYMGLLGVLFSATEIYRSSGNDFTKARENLIRDGGGAVGEFGAVYLTAYHLYSERTQGSLPPRPLTMLINDILIVIPGVDHIEPHPMYWYARSYFPKADVPPQTIGLIAESALWGGEIDLAVRGLLNGILFAWLMRWCMARRGQWVPVVVFVYVYATCVLTLKYSLLYHLQPLSRMILPALVLHQIFLRILRFLRSVAPPSVAASA